MTGIAAAAAGMLIMGGILALIIGVRRTARPVRTGAWTSGELWARWTRRPPGAKGRRRDTIMVISLAAGFVVAALSGWVVAIILTPLLALGLPYLLVLPKARDVELLEALDRWIRALAASLATGKSVTDAIRISRRTAPTLIADEINLLVVRLNNRWDSRDALMRFADELDSPDADGVIAALMLAVSRGANGASQTLQALADSIQAQLKGRRLIEVERAKPYVVVRQVTVISMITLLGVYLLAPGFFDPYRSPLGQMIMSVLLVGYLGSLILMRRKARQFPRPRILVRTAR